MFNSVKAMFGGGEEKKLKSLRRFNIIMAILHFCQGVAMLYLSSDFSLPVTSSYLKFNTATQSLVSDPQVLFSLHIGPLVALFLFISSAAHLLVSLPSINLWYSNNLKKGINIARWVEYSFSSSIMLIVIAMLVGIYDISALILLFFLNAMMILFGWVMEIHNQTTSKTNWLSFYFGSLAGLITWVAIALYLFSVGTDGSKPPTFVYWIYFSIFLFFNCFAANMILQYKKIGKWEEYLYGERAYIILSLVAKSLLAWQVWAGTLRPV